MMMYLDETSAHQYYDEFVLRLSEFMAVIENPSVLTDCVGISKHVLAREFYKGLMLARKLMEYEDERLANVAAGLPKSVSAG
jgi:flagellar protein FlbT